MKLLLIALSLVSATVGGLVSYAIWYEEPKLCTVKFEDSTFSLQPGQYLEIPPEPDLELLRQLAEAEELVENYKERSRYWMQRYVEEDRVLSLRIGYGKELEAERERLRERLYLQTKTFDELQRQTRYKPWSSIEELRLWYESKQGDWNGFALTGGGDCDKWVEHVQSAAMADGRLLNPEYIDQNGKLGTATVHTVGQPHYIITAFVGNKVVWFEAGVENPKFATAFTRDSPSEWAKWKSR